MSVEIKETWRVALGVVRASEELLAAQSEGVGMSELVTLGNVSEGSVGCKGNVSSAPLRDCRLGWRRVEVKGPRRAGAGYRMLGSAEEVPMIWTCSLSRHFNRE